VLGATAEILHELEQARDSEQTDRYDLTIDRYTVLCDSLAQAFAPDTGTDRQEIGAQSETCQRCGQARPDPLVALAADWGSGAALYTAVCAGCVQEHADYWEQRRRRDGAPGS
jgi:hypothetical protein